ncbi:hypothetical protein ACC684_29945 [Rhizobium ruizarguesonis]|uniref:Uncharacterized protein n=1 Tax=Rhizobium ruizarguesonis TaxID=2081791 RepID=A0AB38HU37_9HYPH|nr:hypothetical protein [Rhizobium ruizarguesonis]TBA13877.1 hypothetical protein ELH61_28165 [Rhizobium ruizarguesonis]TBB58508.1 hypothetical protein ELH42_30275 [Rhizobium ruizarguesonis]TBB60451.1 hypothetical protein ELH45_34550 [Rhizobium ruizarguesonis]TBB83508.1 hypothetical protein ELH39_32105 [Rhizobium ruizarguesonis]TBC04680.1 hypothetical protein ELH40_34945 [Rhizobium ruizarguesonis]
MAEQWSANAGELESPTLGTWRATTGLPWIAFWFRELLRCGILDPFVAFALAQGIEDTREDGHALKPEFEAWMDAGGTAKDPEALIDPQNLTAWQQSRERS